LVYQCLRVSELHFCLFRFTFIRFEWTLLKKNVQLFETEKRKNAELFRSTVYLNEIFFFQCLPNQNETAFIIQEQKKTLQTVYVPRKPFFVSGNDKIGSVLFKKRILKATRTAWPVHIFQQ
jgi:hypothetical protein